MDSCGFPHGLFVSDPRRSSCTDISVDSCRIGPERPDLCEGQRNSLVARAGLADDGSETREDCRQSCQIGVPRLRGWSSHHVGVTTNQATYETRYETAAL